MAIYILPALYSGEVLKWIYSAAYVWLLLYAVIHILALLNRKRKARHLKSIKLSLQPILGLCLTIGGLYFAFMGNHGEFGLRAIGILLIVFSVTAVSLKVFKKKKVFYPEFTITAKEIHDQLVK